MKKLLEVRLGGGEIKSGLVPFQSFNFFKQLVASLQDEGGTPEDWQRANLHLEIVGAASTEVAIHAEPVTPLRGPSRKFVNKARKHELTGRGRRFALEHFRPGTPWKYAEIITGDRNPVRVRLDADYRHELIEAAEVVSGTDEIYVKIVRVGGENPPRVKLDVPGMGPGTYTIQSVPLAKKLARRLYDTVKLVVHSEYNRKNLQVSNMEVIDLDEDWQDVHLGNLLEANGGILPLELFVSSTSDLLRRRREEREKVEV